MKTLAKLETRTLHSPVKTDSQYKLKTLAWQTRSQCTRGTSSSRGSTPNSASNDSYKTYILNSLQNPQPWDSPKTQPEPPNKFRRIEDSPSPEESSSSSAGSSWGDAASTSEGETEKGAAPPGPAHRHQRKRLHRPWKLERKRHRKLVRFLEPVAKMKNYRP
nr:MAG: ORF3 [Torque teno polar bear virus 31]